nr:hypothetical protein [Tanacetum cinerariifolium]
SEDSMVTYTTVSSPYEGRSEDVSPGVDGPPIMPEDPYAYVVAAFQALPPPDYPLPAAATPTTDSPGYIPESDPDEDPEDDDDEDPEEDPTDYPADHDDKEEEEDPSKDDADEEDEEQDEDDDDEEEEHPASADSILPILLIPLPAASPPLQLLSSDRRADRPEVTLPPRKRLSIVHCSGYEAGESSVVVAARPIEGRRADYGFVDFVEAEIKRRRAEDIGYGIRDTWIDPRDVAEEEALTTLKGVNTRVTELAAVQEQDTQGIYRVMEDTQGRQTEIFQRVEALVDDRQYHYETGRDSNTPSDSYSAASHFEGVTDWYQSQGYREPDTIMSDFENSTVTYTTVSSPYEGRSGDISPGVDGPPVMPEDPYAYVVAAFQALPPPDYVPGPEEALTSPLLPAAASPTADSPGYIPESDPDEDPEDDDDQKDSEEDPTDYPDKDDDDEEEEHPASADSILPPPALCVTARISFRPQPPTLSFTKEDAERADRPEVTLPPQKSITPILPIPLPAASPPLQLLSSDGRADRPEVTLPPQKRS